jgi:hypothetical protein
MKMIEQIIKTVMSLESLDISVPYLAIRIENGQASMHLMADVFSQIVADVDPILILKMPFNIDGYPPKVEHSIQIGTVRVFALYEV